MFSDWFLWLCSADRGPETGSARNHSSGYSAATAALFVVMLGILWFLWFFEFQCVFAVFVVVRGLSWFIVV